VAKCATVLAGVLMILTGNHLGRLGGEDCAQQQQDENTPAAGQRLALHSFSILSEAGQNARVSEKQLPGYPPARKR
jgi:hypothetical protein